MTVKFLKICEQSLLYTLRGKGGEGCRVKRVGEKGEGMRDCEEINEKGEKEGLRGRG